MLTFYIKTGCPYCKRVLEKIEELHIKAKFKNRDEPGVIDELIARGGKRQFPYMVDNEAGIEMYESEDIAEYLDKKFGGEGKKKEKTRTLLKENLETVCEI